MKNSIKGRKKRDIDTAVNFPESLYDSNPSDYEDLVEALKEEYPMEKRFLGEFSLSYKFSS